MQHSRITILVCERTNSRSRHSRILVAAGRHVVHPSHGRTGKNHRCKKIVIVVAGGGVIQIAGRALMKLLMVRPVLKRIRAGT